MSKVGFVGVGNIGFYMAHRLQEAGHSLVVNDINNDRAHELVGADGVVAAKAKDVADAAEIIFLSLPTPKALKNVLEGPDGLVSGSTVRLVIDLSTVGPLAAEAASELCHVCGIDYLDAPVSGGVPGAKIGTLAIMTAGSAQAHEKARIYLQQIGRPIRVGNTAGRGQALKLLNNYLSATATAATAEAIVLGVRIGLDPEVMLEVFNASSGRNTATTDKFPQSVLDRSFDYGFRTALLHKDVRLCREFADSYEAVFPVMEAVDRAWQQAAAELGDQDFTRIVQMLERSLDVIVGSDNVYSPAGDRNHD